MEVRSRSCERGEINVAQGGGRSPFFEGVKKKGKLGRGCTDGNSLRSKGEGGSK